MGDPNNEYYSSFPDCFCTLHQNLYHNISHCFSSPYIFVYNHQRRRIIVFFWWADNQDILRMWIKSASDVQFSEKMVRQWTRLALWPLSSQTFCGSKPLISSRLLRQAETSIPSFCLSTNGCRCCSITRSYLTESI